MNELMWGNYAQGYGGDGDRYGKMGGDGDTWDGDGDKMMGMSVDGDRNLSPCSCLL